MRVLNCADGFSELQGALMEKTVSSLPSRFAVFVAGAMFALFCLSTCSTDAAEALEKGGQWQRALTMLQLGIAR